MGVFGGTLSPLDIFRSTFSPLDIFGAMSVKCKNIRCKYCDDTNICFLFKIDINEEGQCASFEEADVNGDGIPKNLYYQNK